MLRVPTTVELSPIEGLGLFAARRISMGEVVWVFDPDLDRRIDLESYERLPPRQRAFFDRYGNFMGRHVTVSLDNTRFWNHADKPNLIMTEERCIKARRDISAGEELTLDYRETSDNPFRGFTPNQGQK